MRHITGIMLAVLTMLSAGCASADTYEQLTRSFQPGAERIVSRQVDPVVNIVFSPGRVPSPEEECERTNPDVPRARRAEACGVWIGDARVSWTHSAEDLDRFARDVGADRVTLYEPKFVNDRTRIVVRFRRRPGDGASPPGG